MTVAAAPLGLLVSIMVISSLFYAAVALSGRKPEYHTLMSICTYAAVVEVFRAQGATIKPDPGHLEPLYRLIPGGVPAA